MKDYYYNNPVYKEKQKALYYKNKYGVETLAEVNKIKAEKVREQIRISLLNLEAKSVRRRNNLSFEDFVVKAN